MLADEKTQARRFVEEIWNQGQFQDLDEILCPDVRYHTPADPRLLSVRESIRSMRHAFPDLRLELTDVLIAEVEQVAGRWVMTGTQSNWLGSLAPTGRSIRVEGMFILRFDDERILEIWMLYNVLEFLEQLGARVEMMHLSKEVLSTEC